MFLASPDALEVIVVTYCLSHSLSISTDLTDVTLVSDDTWGWEPFFGSGVLKVSQIIPVTRVSDEL